MKKQFKQAIFDPAFFIRKRLTSKIAAKAHLIRGIVLDFGCGEKPYESLFKYDQYIGLDIEKSGHKYKGEKIDVFYDGDTIPFSDEHFDSIFCSEVLEHVFNIDNVLAELARVIKPRGTLLLTVPFCWHEHEAPFDFARYTSYGIEFLLKKHGFNVSEKIKTTNTVETALQLLANAVFNTFSKSNRLIRGAVLLLIVSPINLVNLRFGKLFPKNDELFFSCVVIAKKKELLSAESDSPPVA